ncbi:uncharacterized protein LOC142765414 isoform X3 [Rhipicephalus microplus]|uniref:uncharacterized protein LOC142765414 isoform X3 n=1 Tax=Rhipicephalus microplus TaxID=6941 RepID=UPI003F6CA904
MNTELKFFALYSTALLLTMLVEKSTCPNGNGPPRDRSPHNPSRFPSTTPSSPIPRPSVQSLQYPQPLGPIPGPSGRLSPIPGPSGHRGPPVAGGSLIARPGSPPRFGGIRISSPSSPLTLDSVVIGGATSPPRLSHFPGPSGQSPGLAPEVVFPGPNWSPPPLSPVASPSGRSPGLAPDVVFPGPSWSPPPLSPVAGPSGPRWPPSPNSARSNSPLLRDTLRMLAPRPGEPGSELNPGTVQPGPTHRWMAAAFYGGLIPLERVKGKGEECSKRSICEEGTCCLDFGRKRKRCKPLGKRGERCVEWAITTVYYGVCPCDPYEGICQSGICV